MSIKDQVFKKMQECQEEHGGLALDEVRHSLERRFSKHTGRNLLVYHSGWMDQERLGCDVDISDGDLIEIDELTNGMDGHELDLIIHSPGGDIDAAAAMVRILRAKFQDVRVIVPHLAMSAAAMIACSGNKIVMGNHSFLGPIDPQMLFNHNNELYRAPAQTIIAEFEMVLREAHMTELSNANQFLLNKYQPGQVHLCRQAMAFSREYVRSWLSSYMFKDDKERESKADAASDFLLKRFASHNKHIHRDELIEEGFVVSGINIGEIEYEMVMSIHQACNYTIKFSDSITKIIENHKGELELRFS